MRLMGANRTFCDIFFYWPLNAGVGEIDGSMRLTNSDLAVRQAASLNHTVSFRYAAGKHIPRFVYSMNICMYI